MPGQLLVGFKAPVSAGAQADVLAGVGARPLRRFPAIQGSLVSIPARQANETIAALERDPRVAYAEPNFLVHADDHGGSPDDPSMHQLWGLDNFGQTVNWTAGMPDADIDAQEAWSVSTGSPNVVVAVIDTGVDGSHPDLVPNLWVNEERTARGAGRTRSTTTGTATSTTGAAGTS